MRDSDSVGISLLLITLVVSFANEVRIVMSGDSELYSVGFAYGDGKNVDVIEFHGQHFIVNSVGKSLCLDSDNKSVISDPFENSGKHHWFIARQANGQFFLLSSRSGKFVKVLDSTSPHPTLVCTSLPFYWEISADGRGYNLCLPNSNLGLSLGDSASLLPLSQHPAETRLYILENNPQNEATVKSGKIDQPDGPSVTTSANIINIAINDLAGSKDTVSQLENFFKSEGTKNLAIYLGNHQIMNPSVIGSSPPPPTAQVGNPSANQRSTGFPTGYFRIRAVSCPGFYLCAYNSSSYYGSDGLPIRLVNGLTRSGESQSIHKEIFFVNTRGELCCDGGQVDVINNVLLVSRQRPPTAPWPNPWSHPFPTFIYSSGTKTISVKFEYDPLLSTDWPRPEKDWKDKEFSLIQGFPATITFPLLSDLKRWAPKDISIPWFGNRYTMTANQDSSVGVVETSVLRMIIDGKRTQWEIEGL